MSEKLLTLTDITISPLTTSTWQDFVSLFDQSGVTRGCWCMYWRVSRQQFQRDYGEGNQQALKAIVDGGTVPGILAYHQAKSIGWCSIAPRQDFASLERSRTLRRVDEQPVWSIVCFFIDKTYRSLGVIDLLIQAAIDYASQHGARIVEAYPLSVDAAATQPYERYMGVRPSFEQLGFVEVASRTARRTIMRYIIK